MLEEALEKHRQGDQAEAERLYREALEQEPENFEALHLLGVLKMDQGQMDEARELVEKALELRPQAAAFRATLAGILHRGGDLTGAAEQIQKALNDNPNLPMGHNTLGYLQFRLGDLEAAERTLEMALRLEPESDQAMTNLGMVLVAAGRPDEAVKHLQEAIDKAPDSVATRAALGEAFLAQGAVAIAEECFRQCLEQQPESHALKLRLGQTLLDGYHLAEADRLFTEVLDAVPEQADALAGLGEIALQTGQAETASKLFQRALVQRRGDALLLGRLTDALIDLSDFASALKICDALEGRLPPGPLARKRGRILHLQERNEEALVALRAALDADPNDSEAALLLAETLELEERQDEARALLEGFPEEAPLQHRIQLALAALDMAAGQPTDALGRLDGMEIGMLSKPEQASIEEMFARALDAEQRFEEASQFMRKIGNTIASKPPTWPAAPVGFEVAEQWARQGPDDGRSDPILLLGAPGSGVAAVVHALNRLPDVEVLSDRLTAPDARLDCLTSKEVQDDLLEFDETRVRLARKDYWQGVERTRTKKQGRVLAIDWIPSTHFDPVQVARFFPGATVLVIDRHPGDLLLHATCLGWRSGMQLEESDIERFETPLIEAGQRLGLTIERLELDALASGQAGALRPLAEAMEIDAQGLEDHLIQGLAGTGKLVQYFPAGHWQQYAAHFGWDSDRLNTLAAAR